MAWAQYDKYRWLTDQFDKNLVYAPYTELTFGTDGKLTTHKLHSGKFKRAVGYVVSPPDDGYTKKYMLVRFYDSRIKNVNDILKTIAYYFKPDRIRNLHIGDKVSTPDGEGVIYNFDEDIVLIEKAGEECLIEYDESEVKRI